MSMARIVAAHAFFQVYVHLKRLIQHPANDLN